MEPMRKVVCTLRFARVIRGQSHPNLLCTVHISSHALNELLQLWSYPVELFESNHAYAVRIQGCPDLLNSSLHPQGSTCVACQTLQHGGLWGEICKVIIEPLWSLCSTSHTATGWSI